MQNTAHTREKRLRLYVASMFRTIRLFSVMSARPPHEDDRADGAEEHVEVLKQGLDVAQGLREHRAQTFRKVRRLIEHWYDNRNLHSVRYYTKSMPQ